MIGSRRVDAAIVQALRARAFALQALSPSPEAAARSLPRENGFFSHEGWRLFLRTERCALQLHRAIERTESWRVVPEAFRTTLVREAEWEMQHVLSARRQLRAIGVWAEANGCRPVVLKGGVVAPHPDCVDLNDIDILLAEEGAKRLTESFIDRGYRPAGHSSVHHFRGLAHEGELLIEVHRSVPFSGVEGDSGFEGRLQEMPELPGLWSLASMDHLWNVLTHIVVEHPSRRGRLRDLLLLRSALASCSARDVEHTKRLAAEHELSEPLTTALAHAVRWSDGMSTDDPFIGTALTGYVLGQRKQNRSRVHPTSGRINQCVYALLLGPVERRAIWAEVRAEFAGLSGHGVIRRLQRINPRLGRFAHVGARLLNRAVSFARAYPIAASIRRRAPQYLRLAARSTPD